MDQDSSGSLERDEIEKFLDGLQQVGVEGMPWGDAKDFVDKLDQNSDNKISFDEFAKGVGGMLALSKKEQVSVPLSSCSARDPLPMLVINARMR